MRCGCLTSILFNFLRGVARNVGVAVWSLLNVTDFDSRMLLVDVSLSLRDTVSQSRSAASVLGGEGARDEPAPNVEPAEPDVS